MIRNQLKQQSPTFLSPGTSLEEDSFSVDLAGGVDNCRVIQAYCIYYYFISIFIISALPQIIWQILEFGTPELKDLMSLQYGGLEPALLEIIVFVKFV